MSEKEKKWETRLSIKQQTFLIRTYTNKIHPTTCLGGGRLQVIEGRETRSNVKTQRSGNWVRAMSSDSNASMPMLANIW